jgi:hypothetical protein
MTELARIACYNDLVEAFRARKVELGLSDEALDHRAGLTRGHAGKLLGPSRDKGIGAATIGALMDALGVAFLMVEDPEKLAQAGEVERRAEWRVRDGLFTIKKARRIVLSRMSAKANKARWKDTTPEERKAVSEVLHRAKAAKKGLRRGTQEAA